jgi:glutamate N-acetyltransferase/amino-acid N-acetyltransferase
MLVYLFTDIDATSAELRELLPAAVERSFNSISIDGDTSTNDTVLLLASGASGVKLDARTRESFAHALDLVCRKLAYAIVDDGEGVTHVVTLHVTGARNEREAKQIAKSIAHSPLCKTAWSSADPNWGRLLAAAGYSGVEFDPARVTIRIGAEPVYEGGMRSVKFDETRAHEVMKHRDYTITMDMGQGNAECLFVTCDMTEEYVRINADYST